MLVQLDFVGLPLVYCKPIAVKSGASIINLELPFNSFQCFDSILRGIDSINPSSDRVKLYNFGLG